MRFLAIDLGEKRTGLAVGDSITGLVSPLEVLQVAAAENGGETLLRAIVRAVEEQLGARDELVVGLPFNMDGTEGPGAKRVREFGARIGERSRRVVHFQDERLTSADAEWSLARSGLTHKQKKERRDAVAAAAILRDFLEARKRGDGGNSGGA